jgi:hypothetical protein
MEFDEYGSESLGECDDGPDVAVGQEAFEVVVGVDVRLDLFVLWAP